MEKILVTGGCGYIGSHTIVDLVANGFEVICVDNNVRSSPRILEGVEKITGKKVPVIEAPRRPGDPPELYADSTKAQRELGWKIKFPDIESIVATAWKWHSTHPRGFKG